MERIYAFVDVEVPLSEKELALVLEFFPDDDGYSEESLEDFDGFFRYWFIADFYSEGTDDDPEFDPEFDTWELAYERVESVCRRLNWISPFCFKIDDGSQFGAYVEQED